ncbi:MAG: lytic transglycosylase domain-containing protein [Bacillota bacterium]|jgi:soluble lytic murein transglycosylase-like protein
MFVGKINNTIAESFDFSVHKTVEKGEFSRILKTATTKSQFDPLFHKAEKEWNIPAGLLKAVAKAESNFDPNAVSSAGAQGIMQLMPETGRSLGVTNPFDPEENINGAAKYLRSLLDRYEGDVRLALAAYNAGPGNVKKYQGIPPFKETERYLEKVLGTENKGGEQVIKDKTFPEVFSQRDAILEEDNSREYLRYLIELYLIKTVLNTEGKKNNFFEWSI